MTIPAVCSSSRDQFACNNGNCVSLSYKCDRDNNCGDNSDEFGCSKYLACMVGCSDVCL